MVASRWPWRLDFLAAAIKRSISAVVRYSRVRTEEFTVVGGDRPPLRFSMIFCPRSKITRELSIVSSLVSIGVVGVHGLDQAGSTPERRPIARRARLLIICSATSAYGNDADTADQADSLVPRTRCTSSQKHPRHGLPSRARDRDRRDVAHLAWRDKRRARQYQAASSLD